MTSSAHDDRKTAADTPSGVVIDPDDPLLQALANLPPGELRAALPPVISDAQRAGLPPGDYNAEGLEESRAWQKHRMRQRMPIKVPKG